MIILSLPIIVVIVERLQEVLEDPAGYLFTLLPRRFVREAEVDAIVNAGIDHFLPRFREAVIRARVLDGRAHVGGRR